MKTYKRIIFYYFTGTGNSGKVVHWIKEVADTLEMDTRLINIAKTDRKHIEPPDPDALLVFTSPVHGFNYPPIMMHFIMRFPRGNNHVALTNTRAGMLIGKLITPGLSGITFYLSALLLLIKGFRIRAMFPVDLPSNWISLHPGLNRATIKYLHARNKKRVTRFAQKLLAGQKQFRALREIIQDLIISPAAIAYYMAGRFLFAKSFYANPSCDNCGICYTHCPVKAIKLIDGRPFWTYDCESCMHCMSHCPKEAVETGHGYIIAIFFISSGIWTGLMYLIPVPEFMEENHWLLFVIETGLFFIFLTLWYRFIHFLLRLPVIAKLVHYTSLTRYKFWGRRYKALPDKAFE